MKKKLVQVFLLLFVLSYSYLACGQRMCLAFSTGYKSVALYPFYKLIGPKYYPYFSASAEYFYSREKAGRFLQTAQLSYYYHRYIGYGISMHSDIGYRYIFKHGWYPEVFLGLGYLHGFQYQQSYQLNNSGFYERKHNTGRPYLLLPLTLGIGKEISGKAIFIRYQYMIQWKYNRTIPVLPTAVVAVGIRINIKQHEKK